MLEKQKLILQSPPENSWRRVSLRYRGKDEELARRKNISSGLPVSFSTRSRVAYTSGPCLHVSCGTSRWKRQGMETSDGGERQLGC